MLGFSYYFWICSILFTANQIVEKCGIFIPLIHSYLDDVLCPGIVLGIALFVQQQLTYKDLSYKLTNLNLIFFVLWYSLLFEILFPLFDQRHHADPLDVLAYVIGTIAFALFGNNGVEGRAFFRKSPN